MGRLSQPPVAKPYLYLPGGWDTHWKAAKGAGSPSVVVLGDSIASGSTLPSAILANSFPGLVKASLLSRLGISLAAEYFSVALSQDGQFNSLAGAPWDAIENGSATVSHTVGWHRSLFSAGETGQWILTFTSPYACTAMDLNYFDWTPGGTFQYRVDGGTAQTVSLNGNSSVNQVQLSGLSSTTHTIQVGQSNNANNFFTMGVSCYPSGRAAAGLQLARMSAGGMGLVEISGAGQVSGSSYPNDRFGLFTGKTPQSDSGAISTPFGFPLNPDLLILELGVNDCNAGETATGSASYQAWMQRLITAVRRATPDCSVLILIACYPDVSSSTIYTDDATGLSNPAQYQQYVGAAYAVANEMSCAVANVHAKWGSNPFGKGFMTASSIHPNASGHSDIANLILNAT